VDGAGAPIGIATDRDLREKVVAEGRDVRAPLRDIMSRPLIQVDAKDHCFEAVLRMIKHNIHHVLVSREGRVRGVLTNHDLMLLQGTSPLSLAKDIEGQQTIEGLAAASGKIDTLIRLLVKEGAGADNIMRIISEINDRLVRKVLGLAERGLGTPPVPFCWVVFGSAGRREQTFRTDQDTAILYADPASDREAAGSERYFGELARSAGEGLAQVGFPPCPAGFMASVPAWRMPLKVWKRSLADWMSAPTPAAPLNVPAFFDFRSLYGEPALAEDLRTFFLGLMKERRPFLEHLANRALRNTPPIGFFGSFVVEKGGGRGNVLDLKEKGLLPLVDGIRLFALERGVRETSTLGRISALRESHPIVKQYADELLQAFAFIMLLRIHRQYSRLSEGGVPDDFLDPQRLSNLERRSLKDAFRLTAKVQDLIVERYRSMVW
jgi:CBS domain-containing protein